MILVHLERPPCSSRRQRHGTLPTSTTSAESTGNLLRCVSILALCRINFVHTLGHSASLTLFSKARLFELRTFGPFFLEFIRNQFWKLLSFFRRVASLRSEKGKGGLGLSAQTRTNWPSTEVGGWRERVCGTSFLCKGDSKPARL
jgi:hypothetical protein